MPSGEGAVADLARAVREVYEAAEEAILRLVAREVRSTVAHADRLDPTGTGMPLAAQAAGLARLRAGLARILARLARSGLSVTALPTLTEARGRGVAAAERELAAWMHQQARRDYQVPGTAALTAAARDLALVDQAAHRAITRTTEDVYRRAVARTLPATVVGAQPSRLGMARQALQDLADRGITTFTDRAGRDWELATYIEMATRTAAARAMVQGQLDRLTASGRRLVFVSNHPQECGWCRPFEHRVLAITGQTGPQKVPHHLTGAPVDVDVMCTVAEAYARGLMHANCRHALSMWLPGVTTLEPDRAKLADPQGERDRARLRALERHVRHWRRREAAAITPLDRQDAAARVKAWRAALRAHVKATGLIRQTKREQPDGPR